MNIYTYIMSKRLSNRMSNIYYSPMGYWKGFSAIKKLAEAARVSEDVSKEWLKKQAVWQVYLLAPSSIPRPKFDVQIPNEIIKQIYYFYHMIKSKEKCINTHLQ